MVNYSKTYFILKVHIKYLPKLIWKVIEQILIRPIDKNHTDYVLWSQYKKLKNINRKYPNI